MKQIRPLFFYAVVVILSLGLAVQTAWNIQQSNRIEELQVAATQSSQPSQLKFRRLEDVVREKLGETSVDYKEYALPAGTTPIEAQTGAKRLEIE